MRIRWWTRWSCRHARQNFLRRFGAAHLARHFPRSEDDDPVADLQDLLQLRRYDDRGPTGGDKLIDDLENLLFGALVDSSRWLVTEQEARIGEQAPGEDNLLLIATAQIFDWQIRGR